MEYDFKPEDVIVNSWSSKEQGSWSVGVPNGVRVVHIPTRITVTYDKERSQHRNRHLAFLELQEKLKAI
jgi:protein subunit release factor A